MSDLAILVVEDNENWQQTLPKILYRLGGDIKVDVASTYAQARQFLLNNRYDLAVVDLVLRGSLTAPGDSEQTSGMELLRELRTSRLNGECGLIMLTAYPSPTYTRQALKQYAADDFIEKATFDGQTFLETARNALLAARLRQARVKDDARYRVTITFDRERFTGSTLTGPDRRSSYTAQHPAPFPVTDLARRADNLNVLVRQGGAELWRPEARSLGDAIYQALGSERRILGDLVSGRALGKRFSDLWLQFEGPATGLGVPFELLRDEGDYLSFESVVSRKLSGVSISRKPESFHRFIQDLKHKEEALRLLLIGANSDGRIRAAEIEATSLATAITEELQRIGVEHAITLLCGADATFAHVQDALRQGNYHVLHYAGHGDYDQSSAEHSGLILPDGNDLRVLSASALNLLARDSALRLVFLSCCLGARAAAHLGHGDFHGMLEALARADVPIVLGYRWEVVDTSALLMATTFYQALWRTFSPGEALLQARRAVALGNRGWNDETWASPVLLTQNG